MTASYRAELVKLVRRRVLLLLVAVTVTFSAGGAAVVLAAADDAGSGAARAGSVEALSAAGGGTEVFRRGAALAGTFAFVVFVGLMAAEFSRGTIATSLLRQPSRVRLLAGKLGATLSVATVALVVAEILTWAAAWVLAPGNGVRNDAWVSLDGLIAAFWDLGAVLVWVTGYAVLGTALAVLLDRKSVV